jgi:biopolymer transport protein ExbD
MAGKIKPSRALGQLSITPLIDIVFLLLIFFLVATRFAEEDRELDVKLPTASEAQPLTASPKELWIGIDKDGTYFVDRQIMTIDEVEQALRAAVTNNPANQSVTIRADRRCGWDCVAQAINACIKTGVRDWKATTAGDEE